ncbi:MAG TPA: ABC transporter substrate-binding protein [Chloroflexota bacterium]|jgi:ABC-type nitrate/sulfonate/bicarbonate transport system substrate-binding protein|nr:ABC transporter substrate-binding protein [Chloroflexota bacterium]
MNTAGPRRSRTTWIFSAFLVCTFVLAGSGVAGAAAASRQHARTHVAMTTVHVDLNWLSNVEFSGLWTALNKGWFAKAHLKISGLCSNTSAFNAGCVRPFDFSNTPEALNDNCVHAGGSLCIGFDDSSAIPIARQAGQLLTGVWVGSQKTPFGFMTCYVPKKPAVNKGCKSNHGKNITSVKQWKGLRIGYQADELYVPEIMLGHSHLSLSNVKPVEVKFDPTLLQSGFVDAYLVFVNNEPIQLKLEHPTVKTNVIPAYSNGMGAFYADTMWVADSQMSKYKNQIKTFVHLVDQGWKYAMHNPTPTAKMVIKHYFTDPSSGGGPGGLKQQELEIAQFAKTLSRDPAGKVDGRMTLTRWKAILHALKTYPGNLGGHPIITTNINPTDCFTNQFAPAAAK